MKKIFTLAFLFFVFSTFAFGQVNDSEQSSVPDDFSDVEKQIYTELRKAQASMAFCVAVPDGPSCKTNDYEKLYRESLDKAISYPKIIRLLISSAAKSYEGNRFGARSAPQVSQIADEQNAQLIRIIVAQNQRIIELLEKLVNKK